MAQTAIFGINSNLDTGGIIDNLVLLQRQPIDIVEAKRALEEAKLLTFQDLRSRLQTFKGIVNTLRSTFFSHPRGLQQQRHRYQLRGQFKHH